MTCKDCVHYDLCKYNTYQQARYFGKDKEIYITIDNNTPCKFFKNKADFVEVVHCKDCGKRYTTNCALWYSTLNDRNYFCGAMSNDDFSCSYGERKTNDE